MSENNFLSECFSKTGNSFDELKKCLSEISDATSMMNIRGLDVKILSPCLLKDYQKEDRIPYYILSKDYLREYLEGSPFHIAYVKKSTFGSYADEIKEKQCVLLAVDKDIYVISSVSFASFCQRIGVVGEITAQRANLYRDLHMADSMFYNNPKLNCLIREDTQDDGTKIRVIFSMPGKEYIYTPLSVMSDVVEALMKNNENLLVYRWEVDHKATNIWLKSDESVEYNGVKFTSGVWLTNSDSLGSSFMIKKCVIINDNVIPVDQKIILHRKVITVDEIIDAYNSLDEGSFIEDIKNLANEKIVDYANISLESENGKDFNLYSVKNLMKKVLKASLGPKFPVKQEKAFISAVTEELKGDKEYSLFDVTLMLFDILKYRTELDVFTKRLVTESLQTFPKNIKKYA